MLDGQAGVFGDGDMVPPSRSRQVDGLGLIIESAEESHGDPECPGTRDRLRDSQLSRSAYDDIRIERPYDDLLCSLRGA